MISSRFDSELFEVLSCIICLHLTIVSRVNLKFTYFDLKSFAFEITKLKSSVQECFAVVGNCLFLSLSFQFFTAFVGVSFG